jgi:hypothetical protein
VQEDGPNGTTLLEVTYEQFSDDTGWVVDGTERATYVPGLTGHSDYEADLALSGDHEGYLRAGATITREGIDGTIESEVDGHRLALP